MFRYNLTLAHTRLTSASAPNFIADHHIKHNTDLQNQSVKFYTSSTNNSPDAIFSTIIGNNLLNHSSNSLRLVLPTL
ncbi:MAG: hypothetical protein RIQ94_1182, partial [Pseudomonadota bacterium]